MDSLFYDISYRIELFILFVLTNKFMLKLVPTFQLRKSMRYKNTVLGKNFYFTKKKIVKKKTFNKIFTLNCFF